MTKIKPTHYINAFMFPKERGIIHPYKVEGTKIMYWDLWGNLVYSSKKDTKGLIPIPEDHTVYSQKDENGGGTYSYIMKKDESTDYLKLSPLVDFLDKYLDREIEKNGYPETLRVILEAGLVAYQEENNCKITTEQKLI